MKGLKGTGVVNLAMHLKKTDMNSQTINRKPNPSKTDMNRMYEQSKLQSLKIRDSWKNLGIKNEVELKDVDGNFQEEPMRDSFGPLPRNDS